MRCWTLAAVCALAFAGAPATEGPFWKVSGNNGTAFLFGSVHFGAEAIYPLDTAVEDAFVRSDRLAVEVDLQAMDSEALLLWIRQHGALTDGTRLSDHVSAETWELFQRRARELHIPPGTFALQRPWLAAFSMTALAMAREGFREELGVDRHFLKRAAGNKSITELETVRGQMELLAGLSPEVEEYFLRMTLEDLATPERTFSALFRAWKSGDAEAIRSHTEKMRAGPYGEVLIRQLIDQRNEHMTEAIVRLLEEGGTTFVVVGAAHLVGQRGVVSLLASRGYRVEKR